MKRIWIFNILTSILLAFLVVATYLSYKDSIRFKLNGERLKEANFNLLKLQNVISTIKDAEISQRGYILTLNKEFIQLYEGSYKKSMDNYNDFRSWGLKYKVVRAERLDSLKHLIDYRFQLLARVMNSRISEKVSSEQLVNLMEKEQSIMNRIRNLTAELRDSVMASLEAHSAEEESYRNRLLQLELWSAIISFVIFLLLLIKTNAELRTNMLIQRHLNKELEAKEITSKKLQEQYIKLESFNKELIELNYITTHDLKEPLRSIRSFTQLLVKKFEDQKDPEITEYSNYITNSVKKLVGLLDGLRQYSEVQLANEAIIEQDCNQIIENIKKNLHDHIHDKEVIINYESLPKVKAGPKELELLFTNLIENSIKFSKPGIPAIIDISARSRDDFWVFRVRDNGIGMKNEYKEKVFKLFQRLHSYDEYQGRGIGLTLCKKILERYHGDIWFESEFGVGTTFHFSFPKENLV